MNRQGNWRQTIFEPVRKYRLVLIVLAGIAALVGLPLSLNGRGLVLGGTAAVALVFLLQPFFDNSTPAVTGVLPKDVRLKSPGVTAVGLASTGIVLVTLMWLVANVNSTNQSLLIESFLAVFLLVVCLYVALLVASTALLDEE